MDSASSMQAVSLLATKFPETAQMKFAPAGDTPLHLLCGGRGTETTVETVDLLIKGLEQEGFASTNSFGCTPLYLACWAWASSQVIQMLLAGAGPKSCQSAHQQGETVLHIACNRDVPIATISYVIHLWPVACGFAFCCFYLQAVSPAEYPNVTLWLCCRSNSASRDNLLDRRGNKGACLCLDRIRTQPVHFNARYCE
jgi:hypothetical protein